MTKYDSCTLALLQKNPCGTFMAFSSSFLYFPFSSFFYLNIFVPSSFLLYLFFLPSIKIWEDIAKLLGPDSMTRRVMMRAENGIDLLSKLFNKYRNKKMTSNGKTSVERRKYKKAMLTTIMCGVMLWPSRTPAISYWRGRGNMGKG